MSAEPLAVEPIPESNQRKQSYARLVARQYRKRTMSVIALVLLIVLGVVGILAPFIAGGIPIYMKKDGATYWLPNIISYDELLFFDYARWTPGPATTCCCRAPPRTAGCPPGASRCGCT